VLRDPLDESAEVLDVRDVFSAKPRQASADILVESHAVRGERIPKLTRESSAADVPIRENDRFAIRRSNRFAKAEHRRPLVDHPNVARHPERPQGPLVILAFDDDRRAAILLDEIFEDAHQILVQPIPVRHSPPPEAESGAGREKERTKNDSTIDVRLQESGEDKGCVAEAIIYRPPDMRAVPGEEEVNFERVTKVYREESGKKTLVALEADFYDKLAAYVARLDESANKEAQKDPNSPKALLLQDELRKVRKRRDQIFTYRERKLALLASSRASGAEVEVPNLPAQERVLFDQMVSLLKKSRSDAFGGSMLGTEPSPPVPAPKPESAPVATRPGPVKILRAEATKRTPVAPTLKDHVLVHVLEDLPPFAGIDTTYRLKKEDVVTLPKTIAQILVDRGKARIVQMSGTAV
jgi:DNA replication initiation complex subunit (GINS family)